MRAELYNIRFQRLEKLTSSMVESQASMVQILQEQSEQLQAIQQRRDALESRVDTLADDVAFIRNYIETKDLS